VSARPPFPEVIDNSMLSSFKKCNLDWYYSSLLSITRKGGNIHLHAGGAYASGLEHARLAFYDEGLSEEDSILSGLKALTLYWGDFEPPPDSKKTYPTMCLALIEYFIQYPMGNDIIKPLRLPSGKSAVEFTFAIPIPGTKHPQTGQPILYAGRFDMLCLRDGVLFGEDDKTASQLGAQWNRNWTLDSQFTGYCWAAQTFDYPVAGFIIRGLSILANSFGHAQAITYRPDWQIERWLEMTVSKVEEMISSWERNTFLPTFDKHACNSYGGCGYSPLCESRNPQGRIDFEYEAKFWNPLAKGDESVTFPVNT
jgi:hypothetical protein